MSARSMTILHRGDVQTAYRVTGDGSPLLLIHGAEGDHSLFDPLVAALGDSFRMIAYDQRNCGATMAGAKPYTLLDLARDAVELLDALHIPRVSIFGNSAGGLIAQMIALNWPERVDRLILSVTFPLDSSLAHANPEGLARRADLISKGDDLGLAELFTTPRYAAGDPDLVEQLKRLRGSTPVEAARRRLDALTRPSADDPADIRCPTLVIAGAADQIVPSAEVTRLAAMIPEARLEIIPDAGHLVLRQSIDVVSLFVRRFLNA